MRSHGVELPCRAVVATGGERRPRREPERRSGNGNVSLTCWALHSVSFQMRGVETTNETDRTSRGAHQDNCFAGCYRFGQCDAWFKQPVKQSRHCDLHCTQHLERNLRSYNTLINLVFQLFYLVFLDCLLSKCKKLVLFRVARPYHYSTCRVVIFGNYDHESGAGSSLLVSAKPDNVWARVYVRLCFLLLHRRPC